MEAPCRRLTPLLEQGGGPPPATGTMLRKLLSAPGGCPVSLAAFLKIWEYGGIAIYGSSTLAGRGIPTMTAARARALATLGRRAPAPVVSRGAGAISAPMRWTPPCKLPSSGAVHVKSLYQQHPPRSLLHPNRAAVRVQLFLDAFTRQDTATALRALSRLPPDLPAFAECKRLLLQRLASADNVLILDVKQALALGDSTSQDATLGATSGAAGGADSITSYIAALINAYRLAPAAMKPAVRRYIHDKVSPTALDSFRLAPELAPTLASAAAELWPQRSFETTPNPVLIKPYLNSDGLVSFDSLCRYISLTKVCDDTWETYRALDPERQRQFLDDLERHGRQRQLEIEAHCQLIADLTPRRQHHEVRRWIDEAATALAASDTLLLRPALVKHQPFLRLIGFRAVARLAISRIVAANFADDGADVATLTTSLLASFAARLRALLAPTLLSFREGVEVAATVIKTVVDTCRVSPELWRQYRLERQLRDDGALNGADGADEPPLAFIHSFKYTHGHAQGQVLLHPLTIAELSDLATRHAIPMYLPMVCEPQPWTLPTTGGYLTNLKGMVVGGAPEYMVGAHATGQLAPTYRALNQLAQVEWTINTKVLQVFNQAMAIGTAQSAPGIGATPAPALALQVPGVDLPNPGPTDSNGRALRSHYERLAMVATAFAGDRFFLPQMIDFRGRAYPAALVLTHYQEDVARALLAFWRPRRLGARGFYWLQYHLALVYGNTELSLDERLDWVKQHLSEIRGSAQDPWGHQWWQQGDKPWQVLALCFEVDNVLTHEQAGKSIEDYLSHIPVHQDGLCNGFQQFAALGADVEGAKSVNLVPGPRGDVYSAVLDIVRAKVERDCEQNHPLAQLAQPILSRKLIKQTVMTTVYGVTAYGGAQQIKERIKHLAAPDLTLYEHRYKLGFYLLRQVLDLVSELFAGASRIQKWLVEVCRRLITSHDYATLAQHPNRDILSGKIYKPMMWTTMMGLPVVQIYKRHAPFIVSTELQHIALTDKLKLDVYDKQKLLNGMSPNFVHLVDAMHMAMTAIAAGDHGLTFAAVHDSFWTHACDVDELNVILRRQFVQLHQLGIIEAMRDDALVMAQNQYQLVWVKQDTKVAEYRLQYPIDRSGTKRQVLNRILAYELKALTEGVPLDVYQHLQSQDPTYYQQITAGTLSIYDDQVRDPVPMKVDNVKWMPIWTPVVIPQCPEKGDLDVSVVEQSSHFFS